MNSDSPDSTSGSGRATGRARRSLCVLGVFAVSCACAVGALQLTAGAGPGAAAERAQPAGALQERMASGPAPGALRVPSIAPRMADVDRKRWHAIVIHHSGTPGGDLSSLERRHVQSGLTGLGYHFVIGNGQGLEDGQVVVGYRWDRQLAGAHVAQGAARAAYFNEHAVAICLMGNGERRAFTERQIHELVGLVRQLQAELGIPASGVVLHSDLCSVASPGQFFPKSDVFAQILP